LPAGVKRKWGMPTVSPRGRKNKKKVRTNSLEVSGSRPRQRRQRSPAPPADDANVFGVRPEIIEVDNQAWVSAVNNLVLVNHALHDELRKANQCMEAQQARNYFVQAEFHRHNLLMMQVLVEASGGQMPVEVAQYLGRAQEVRGGAGAALERVHNYHLEQEAAVVDEEEAGEDANAEKDVEAVMDSEVEIVEKGGAEGPQDSDEV